MLMNKKNKTLLKVNLNQGNNKMWEQADLYLMDKIIKKKVSIIDTVYLVFA